VNFVKAEMQVFVSPPTGSGYTCYLVLPWTYARLICCLRPWSIIAQTKGTNSLVNNTGSSYLVGMTYE